LFAGMSVIGWVFDDLDDRGSWIVLSG